MSKKRFASRIKRYVDEEITLAAGFLESDDLRTSLRHLERAHALGQASTIEHTRVHWLMLKPGLKRRDWREIFGQIC